MIKVHFLTLKGFSTFSKILQVLKKKKKVVFEETEETTAVNTDSEIDQEYTIEIEN